ncbi:MAG: CocE/NonD family hydrolase, partial [Gammaproteobacteria bacterium]
GVTVKKKSSDITIFAAITSPPDPATLGQDFAGLFDHIDAFAEVVAALPLERLDAARPDDERFLPFFFEFLRHPAPDDWTASLLFSDRHAEVKVPSLSIAGWHDLLLAADLEHFRGMRTGAGSAEAREHSRLVVGPWSHGMFASVVGEIDFGFRANGLFLDLKEDLTRLQLRWFEHWLGDERSAFADDPPVRLFVQGPNRWRDEDDWPPRGYAAQDWFLAPDGALAPSPPPADAPPSSYVYDPNDPCPTLGGNLLLPPQYVAGPVDQRSIAARRDVLCFLSAPLEADLDVVGHISAELFAATSGPDTDWMVKLCDVWPDGRIMNVCDGVVRASLADGRSRRLLEPGAVTRFDIDLWATAQVFARGHRLAFVVTSSDFPRYDRNPNTGQLAHEATRFEPALQRVFHDAARASRVTLPVRRPA